MNDSSPARVAILALPETTASVIYGMYDFFMSAGRDWGLICEGRPAEPAITPVVVSSRSGAFNAGNNVRITPEATLEACREAEVVCVPELLVPPGETLEGRFEAEIACLHEAYASGKILATACSGALLLAEAGLLDGHEATTHWAYCDLMARRYPQVKVCRQRALVCAGEGQRLIMAGGGTSWLDLALYLIARLSSTTLPCRPRG